MTRPAALARTVGGTAALVIVVLGATARRHLQLTRTRADIHVILVAAWSVIWTVGTVLGVLMIFGRMVGSRQARRAGMPVKAAPRRSYLVIAILIALFIRYRDIVAKGFTGLHGVLPVQEVPTAVPASTDPLVTHNVGSTSATIAALAILLCVAAALAIARRQKTALTPPPGDFPDAKTQDAWANAVGDGSLALADITDPRAAIIACYTAMRTALLDAGVQGRTSDTPGEMLTRIAAAGIAPHAASALTGLFLEARFSTHVINETQRDQALGALTELAAATGALTAGGHPTADVATPGGHP